MGSGQTSGRTVVIYIVFEPALPIEDVVVRSGQTSGQGATGR